MEERLLVKCIQHPPLPPAFGASFSCSGTLRCYSQSATDQGVPLVAIDGRGKQSSRVAPKAVHGVRLLEKPLSAGNYAVCINIVLHLKGCSKHTGPLRQVGSC